MTAALAARPVRGPRGTGAAARLASLARDPLAGYLSMYAAYGDTVRVPISPKSCFFVLTRPEYAEHVLAANQDNYVKAFTYRPLRALIGNGLLTSEGEQWRRHQRVIQPMFARRDVRSFGPAMTAGIGQLLAQWDRAPDGAVLDVAAAMSGLALDIVGRALFSADLTGDADQLSRAMSTGQKIAVLATFAPLSWGPRSTRALKALARAAARTEGIDAPVGRLIAGRRREREPAPGRRDLLDVLMSARFDDGSGRTSTGLTDTEISDELATFMVAGHETSAVTLAWALALLAAYPAARDRLEAEVDDVLGGREPQAADADRLPWTTEVITETLRLYPPAWTIERDAVTADDVAGVPVPAGSTVAIPPYLVHRHPEFWPDPAGFDPARFLAGSGGGGPPLTGPVTPTSRSAAGSERAWGKRSRSWRRCSHSPPLRADTVSN